MDKSLKLMCVLAHPDDESLGVGGTLVRYCEEGVETYLITATRGEKGRFGTADPKPEPHIVGKAREAELHAAADVLGIREVNFLDYVDGELDQSNPNEVITKIVRHLRRVRPQVVVTFGPDGAYGHPDHIAISQFATAAVVCAADPVFDVGEHAPHRVSKLYYLEWTEDKWAAYQSATKKLVSLVDGIERQATPWPDWAITTVIDTSKHSSTVLRAVRCHQTQMAIYEKFERLPVEQQKQLWGSQEFYRAFSTVNGGRKTETDLFEGLRETSITD